CKQVELRKVARHARIEGVSRTPLPSVLTEGQLPDPHSQSPFLFLFSLGDDCDTCGRVSIDAPFPPCPLAGLSGVLRRRFVPPPPVPASPARAARGGSGRRLS
ncbi:unnamed protein product, partial [Ectocarpus sp. 12 AP-2014]